MRGAIAFCLIAASASCFKVAPSKGGGQVSKQDVAEAKAASPNAYDVELPPGYSIELIAERLTFPTGITFGPGNEIYVVESGYSYGEVFTRPRLLQLVDGGPPRELATGTHGPWNGLSYHDGALFVAQGGAAEGGRIVRFDLDGDRVSEPRVLADKLPSMGDHHTNGPVISPDGWVYFAQGTATNAGVVGTDAADFGWLARHPEVHDIPCKDITLSGLTWETPDPRPGSAPNRKVTTGAYRAFGTAGARGEVIRGRVPCNGAVMRVRTSGGPIELVAWGFRNPFGLAFDGSGVLHVTDNGYDVRGSRPVFGSADWLWRVEPGRWYGWPDFAEGQPLTLPAYAEAGGAPKGFVLASHPDKPSVPAAQFAVHASADGFDFSRSAAFGHVGWAFVALFGDMAPNVGKVVGPVGFQVVRADPRNGDIESFARNRGESEGPASRLGLRGLERPVAARFDPPGNALYIVDFGILRMGDKGPEPQQNTGRIWKIVKGAPNVRP
jgi:glucose/arabinose dehydrogenase